MTAPEPGRDHQAEQDHAEWRGWMEAQGYDFDDDSYQAEAFAAGMQAQRDLDAAQESTRRRKQRDALACQIQSLRVTVANEADGRPVTGMVTDPLMIATKLLPAIYRASNSAARESKPSPGDVTDLLGVAVQALRQIDDTTARSALEIIDRQLPGELRWDLVPLDAQPAPDGTGDEDGPFDVPIVRSGKRAVRTIAAPGTSSLGLKHAVTSNRLGHALAAHREIIRRTEGSGQGLAIAAHGIARKALDDDAAIRDNVELTRLTQPALDPRFPAAVAALRRIACTTGSVVDTAALWKIAGDALNEIDAGPGEPLTHFFHCWRFPDHHACAVALIERQAEENDRLLVRAPSQPAPEATS